MPPHWSAHDLAVANGYKQSSFCYLVLRKAGKLKGIYSSKVSLVFQSWLKDKEVM